MYKKTINLLFFMCIILVSISYVNAVDDSKLAISSLDVILDDETENLVNNNRIRQDIEPGDEIEFRIKITNTYTEEENIKIEKDVVSLTLTTNKYDNDGVMIGYEALFTVYLNGQDPL